MSFVSVCLLSPAIRLIKLVYTLATMSAIYIVNPTLFKIFFSTPGPLTCTYDVSLRCDKRSCARECGMGRELSAHAYNYSPAT